MKIQQIQDDLDEIVGGLDEIAKALKKIKKNRELAELLDAAQLIVLEVSCEFSTRYKTE